MSRQLRTIAVDLTPVLPGGDNGGAKIFVIELLRELADMTPDRQWLLLTQFRSHEELSALERPNVRRIPVIAADPATPGRGRLLGIRSGVQRFLPAGLRNALKRWYHRSSLPRSSGAPRALLRDMRADLLFCPFTAPTYCEPGIPTVCTIYDLQYKTYPEFFEPEDVAHRDRVFRDASRNATALAAISDYSRLSAINNGTLEPSRIRTIYLRIAHRIAPAVEDAPGVLARLGVSRQKYFMYPANFWKHKNHEMLVTAFGIACRGNLPPDIKLVCTGAPSARQQFLISAARNMNLGSRILFPGFLPSDELAVLMTNCIGVVFPSLYEGFGLPVIEAMALRVPVACSNTTSLPEVAAGAAILFDPRIPTQIARSLVSLAVDDALRKNLTECGLQRAAEFSDPRRMAREYLALFEEVFLGARFTDLLAGNYTDGWAGRQLTIQMAPASGQQKLDLEFWAPPWLPKPQVTVQASRDGKEVGVPIVVRRGGNAVVSLPMEATGGSYELRIAPTFVPALSGHGDDQRELSIMLRRCAVVRGGASIELYPPESAR